MHKPSEFEVMHFVLNTCVWFHQGFHANPTFLHGYGLCCRMSDPNQPDDVTSGSNVINPPHNGRQGPTTRQQSTADAIAQAAAAAAAMQAAANRALAASQGAQSASASIDYHSLATAMSRLNDDSASNIEKGLQPKWDFKVETFVDWQNKLDIWAESHDIKHLLLHPPVADPVQQRKHEVAKRVYCSRYPTKTEHMLGVHLR